MFFFAEDMGVFLFQLFEYEETGIKVAPVGAQHIGTRVSGFQYSDHSKR